VNVRSHQLTKFSTIRTQSLTIDALVKLGYGGAVIVFVDAKQFSFAVEPINAQRFISLGREIRASMLRNYRKLYSQYDELAGVVFFEDEGQESDKPAGVIRERNVNVYGDGQIDYSPYGSRTCARLAIHFPDQRISAGYGKLVNRSIIGTVFNGGILSEQHISGLYTNGRRNSEPSWQDEFLY
jgi:trans-L-3-hydroxyproline dehydratase